MADQGKHEKTAHGRPAAPRPDRGDKPDPALEALARYLARIAAERDHAASKVSEASAERGKP